MRVQGTCGRRPGYDKLDEKSCRLRQKLDGRVLERMDGQSVFDRNEDCNTLLHSWVPVRKYVKPKGHRKITPTALRR